MCGLSSFNNIENSGSKFADLVWQEFVSLVVESGFSPQKVMYGVSWPADDSTPPQNIHYFAGFEIDTEFTQAGFEVLDLESGKYFSYKYVGEIVNVDSGFLNAYNVAFPASGLANREGQHLEIYPADCGAAAEIISFDILIPVQ